MKIKEFRYLSANDVFDKKRQAWSRVYEYPYVLGWVKQYLKPHLSIHNTGCGGGDIHLQFAKELEQYGNVLNSDVETIRGDGCPDNYRRRNLEQLPIYQSDIVLCVSTLEHLQYPDRALNNLLESVNKGGLLIITLDCPPIKLDWLEEMLGMKCEEVENKLNPENSICPHPEWKDINIVALVIEK